MGRRATKAFRVTAAVTLALAVSGCSNDPKSGRVVGRPHYAAWTQLYSYRCGKVTCFGTTYHPERWELCVIPDDRQGDFEEQYCFGVSEAMHDRKQMGDHYYTEDGV